MPLKIEYKKAHVGWIEITLHSENGSYDIDISEVYGPFEDWFYALERIYRSEIPSIIINLKTKINFRQRLRQFRDSIYYHQSRRYNLSNRYFT